MPNLRTIPARIIIAIMAPFALMTLIGSGVAVFSAFRLLRWEKAEAVFMGEETGMMRRGDSIDNYTWLKRTYRFKAKDGTQCYLRKLVKYDPSEKKPTSMEILFDPSVKSQVVIEEWQDSLWARASTVTVLLLVGLGLALAGGLPCLLGAGFLVLRVARPSPDSLTQGCRN